MKGTQLTYRQSKSTRKHEKIWGMGKSIVTKLANIYWVIRDLVLCAMCFTCKFQLSTTKILSYYWYFDFHFVLLKWISVRLGAHSLLFLIYSIIHILFLMPVLLFDTLLYSHCLRLNPRSPPLGHLWALPLGLFPWSSDSKLNVLHSRNLQYLLLGSAATFSCLTDFIHF